MTPPLLRSVALALVLSAGPAAAQAEALDLGAQGRVTLGVEGRETRLSVPAGLARQLCRDAGADLDAADLSSGEVACRIAGDVADGLLARGGDSEDDATAEPPAHHESHGDGIVLGDDDDEQDEEDGGTAPAAGDPDRGHGNDADGRDEDNPGRGEGRQGGRGEGKGQGG